MSDSSASSKKKGWPRGRRRNVKIRDANAPKMPMSGYMLFLNDHRESVRAANPAATFSDMTRLLANAWQAATPGDKQRYMEAAQRDRERYNRQLHEYQQTDAYRQFSEQVKAKSAQTPTGGKRSPQQQQSAAATTGTAAESSSSETPAVSETKPPEEAASAVQLSSVDVKAEDPECDKGGGAVDSSPFDVPIFTDQFLAYNRQRDDELRQLRREVSEHEQRNATLQRHLDAVQEAVQRLESEAGSQRGQNAALQQHLTLLRSTLAERFSQLQLPPDLHLVEPTAQNIDEFLSGLADYIGASADPHAVSPQHQSSPQPQSAFTKTVRALVDGIDVQ